MKGLPSEPKKAQVDLLGDRGFPLASAKIPEAFLTDFNELLLFALEKDPSARTEDVVKAIWRHGIKSFWHSLRVHKGAAFKYIPMPEDITKATKV